MKGFISFGTYCQSMYFMLTIFIKDKINEVFVLQFQLAYIRDTTHPSHKHLAKLCYEVHYMLWGDQYLELLEWEDFIRSNKTIILAYIIFLQKIEKGIQRTCHLVYCLFLFLLLCRRCHYHRLVSKHETICVRY